VKEFKVGSIFELGKGVAWDEGIGEMVEMPCAVDSSYVAYLGGPETFGQMIWAEASRRDWEYAADTEVIGDGAAWIWNLALDHFYDSVQIVDWYHATEHLAAVARLIKGEGTAAAKRWFTAQATILYQGRIDQWAGGKCGQTIQGAVHKAGDALEPHRSRAVTPCALCYHEWPLR